MSKNISWTMSLLMLSLLLNCLLAWAIVFPVRHTIVSQRAEISSLKESVQSANYMLFQNEQKIKTLKLEAKFYEKLADATEQTWRECRNSRRRRR